MHAAPRNLKTNMKAEHGAQYDPAQGHVLCLGLFPHRAGYSAQGLHANTKISQTNIVHSVSSKYITIEGHQFSTFYHSNEHSYHSHIVQVRHSALARQSLQIKEFI